VRKWVKPESFEGLRYTPLATDCVKLKKTPLAEFKNYMAGIEREGKNFVPENMDSLAGQLQVGILRKNPSIQGYRHFIFHNADNLNVSKEEYYELIDEIARKVQKEIKQNPGNLRKEFIDNAGKYINGQKFLQPSILKTGKIFTANFMMKKCIKMLSKSIRSLLKN